MFFAPQNQGAFILCPAKLWSNADFAPQNHGDIVSGAKKYHNILLSSFFLIIFVNHCHFQDLYNLLDHFLSKKKTWCHGTFKGMVHLISKLHLKAVFLSIKFNGVISFAQHVWLLRKVCLIFQKLSMRSQK